tara:strand:+ start:64 stop:645 length:582 start_codon:yes stop_codon:yes gene_type:complete
MKHEIFPTPIWQIKGAPQQLIDVLLQGAYACKDQVENNKRSNEGGYQSPPFDWDQFHPEGIQYVEDIVKKEIKEEGEDAQVAKVAWWYNINPTGAWNTPHTHPGVDLAAVLYLTDTQGELAFMPPHNRSIGMNRGYQSMNNKKGDLIIFPSDIIHMVLPNKSKEDRVSISMNINVNLKPFDTPSTTYRYTNSK